MKKKPMAVIALAVGVCCLGASAFANNSASNGYDVFKQAVWNTFGLENYTLSCTMNAVYDGGTELLNAYVLEESGNDLRHTRTDETAIGGSAAHSEEYVAPTYQYMIIDQTSDAKTIVRVDADEDITYQCQGSLASISPTDEDDKRYLSFAELCADAVVGNIKNNFIYEGSTDTLSTYKLELSSSQIPELLNSGLSLMLSSYIDNVDNMEHTEEERIAAELGADARINSVSLEFSVDNEGRFSSINASAVLAGNGHSVTVNISGELTKIGSTEPVIPDEWIQSAVDWNSYIDAQGIGDGFEDTEIIESVG